jgi:hypothetical protein
MLRVGSRGGSPTGSGQGGKSFCLWESCDQARRAASGASHREAAAITAEMYESYTIERYDLTKQGTQKNLVFRRVEEAAPRGSAPGVPA